MSYFLSDPRGKNAAPIILLILGVLQLSGGLFKLITDSKFDNGLLIGPAILMQYCAELLPREWKPLTIVMRIVSLLLILAWMGLSILQGQYLVFVILGILAAVWLVLTLIGKWIKRGRAKSQSI